MFESGTSDCELGELIASECDSDDLNLWFFQELQKKLVENPLFKFAFSHAVSLFCYLGWTTKAPGNRKMNKYFAFSKTLL